MSGEMSVVLYGPFSFYNAEVQKSQGHMGILLKLDKTKPPGLSNQLMGGHVGGKRARYRVGEAKVATPLDSAMMSLIRCGWTRNC